MVGGDVVDGVGCGFRGVELHRVHLNAVDECLDAQVEVLLRVIAACVRSPFVWDQFPWLQWVFIQL